MAWVVNMVCQNIFPFAHCSAGTGLQQNKAYFVLLKKHPAVLSRVFHFPRSQLEAFLAPPFKQRTKLGHCFALLAFGMMRRRL